MIVPTHAKQGLLHELCRGPRTRHMGRQAILRGVWGPILTPCPPLNQFKWISRAVPAAQPCKSLNKQVTKRGNVQGLAQDLLCQHKSDQTNVFHVFLNEESFWNEELLEPDIYCLREQTQSRTKAKVKWDTLPGKPQ